jgi:hypothetical protein
VSRYSDLLETPEFIADLQGETSSLVLAHKWGVGKTFVKDHRAKLRLKDGKPTAVKIADMKAEAGYKFEVGTNGTVDVTTKPTEQPQTVSEAEALLRSKGIDPDLYTVSYGWSEWEQSSKDGGLRTLNAYRIRATPKPASEIQQAVDIDPVGVLARLRAESPVRVGPYILELNDEASAFALSINDIQLGQSYNGGSAATIANFYRFIELAQARILELRKINRRLEGLIMVIGGDLGEGCVIYTNQAFNLDLDRKQQNEGIIALLLHAIDTLAPMFTWVKVLACKGNHGEHRINGKMTTLGDNDDTHAVEMAKLALSRDPSMQHIEWVIAEDEAAVAIDVYKWVLATTHGDVYAKGVSGNTTERKAHAWMKNMAAGRKRFGKIADADVLVTHHFHHEESKDWGDQLWKQTPSQDRGSPGFSQATGTYSEPGMLTWVMTPSSRWKDEAVLR